ncbi:UDP-glucose/GDP-mannose dehydrogenase family protein [candidate division WWE3 bacterium]|jgi:UDPglucose 6-dehydrogenase|uniref:UDP-glucose 6-dehydrogenase n=1 Tax=candidate division WWE3 bacterium TaxID=2053526 RepID=A0A3A4ZHU2_UNCKA|nr:MAG: UDP-glucose/GDP-mannose dehydrogenase family protein [candidate division WWE3 bacterium]
MKLCVIGTGYVGLVGAAIFADWGNEVVGVDIDENKIKKIKNGEMPIYEPGLSEIVLENIKENRLSFTTSIADGMREAEIVFICVGTPQSDTGAADLSAVWNVAKEIGQHLKDYKVIVTKSTVPVGTNEKVREIIKENLKEKVEFDVASNPEFLREGSSVEDMRNTDRTVVGADTQRAHQVMHKLYDHLGTPIVECDLRSAEMIKYSSNAFLATKISFINEIAQICERAQADVTVVARGMGLDRRIGTAFLNAGIGYGGSCFPKDVAALYKTSTDQAYDFKLLRSVMEVNKLQQVNFVDKVKKHFGSNLTGKTLGCLGLAFKGDTDDIRESVSIEVIRQLRGLGAYIKVYDPQASTNARAVLGDTAIEYCEDEYSVMKGSDALFILTEWKQFKGLDLEKVKSLLKNHVIFDGRNLLDKTDVEKSGFTYYAVGKYTKGLKELQDKKVTHTSAVLKNNGS